MTHRFRSETARNHVLDGLVPHPVLRFLKGIVRIRAQGLAEIEHGAMTVNEQNGRVKKGRSQARIAELGLTPVPMPLVPAWPKVFDRMVTNLGHGGWFIHQDESSRITHPLFRSAVNCARDLLSGERQPEPDREAGVELVTVSPRFPARGQQGRFRMLQTIFTDFALV